MARAFRWADTQARACHVPPDTDRAISQRPMIGGYGTLGASARVQIQAPEFEVGSPTLYELGFPREMLYPRSRPWK